MAAASGMSELFALNGDYGIKAFLRNRAFVLGDGHLEEEFEVIEHNKSRPMKGSYGTVMKVRHNDRNGEFAIKRVTLGVSFLN